MNNKNEWIKELLRITKILKDNGVDISTIQSRYSKEGKRYYTVLNDIKHPEMDIGKIIIENGLDENYKIGSEIKRFRNIYNGNVSSELSEEERILAEELGLVKKQTKTSNPIIKGGKVSEFHVKILEENMDKILTGELNTVEILKIVNEEAKKNGEQQIKDAGTIKRSIKKILENDSQMQELYQEVIRHNIGRRSPRTKRRFYRKRTLLEETIINEYLPQILERKMHLVTIVKKLSISEKTVKKIIEDKLEEDGDEEIIKKYREAIESNSGASLEKRQEAESKREKALKSDVVLNAEFLSLPLEEQEEQLLKKVRKEQVKEAIDKSSKELLVKKSRLTSEEYVEERIQYITDYFMEKNNQFGYEAAFSAQDIRYIIFRYPTILRHLAENIDEKFELLLTYDEIDNSNIVGIVNNFPAILGYSTERTKAQLNILKDENLMDYFLSKPCGLMRSPQLIYALIQFAKERHGTNDLTGVNRNNIFMPNATIKRLYGTDYDEIKSKYPYVVESVEEPYFSINGQDIGKKTFDVETSKCDKAYEVLNNLIKENKKKEEI